MTATKSIPYRWRCGCGHEGTGEKAAQAHAATCGLMGWPGTNVAVGK